MHQAIFWKTLALTERFYDLSSNEADNRCDNATLNDTIMNLLQLSAININVGNARPAIHFSFSFYIIRARMDLASREI